MMLRRIKNCLVKIAGHFGLCIYANSLITRKDYFEIKSFWYEEGRAMISFPMFCFSLKKNERFCLEFF